MFDDTFSAFFYKQSENKVKTTGINRSVIKLKKIVELPFYENLSMQTFRIEVRLVHLKRVTECLGRTWRTFCN